jgi:dihydroflavonol-4-reductase
VASGKKVLALKRSGSDIDLTRKIFSFYSDNAEELFSEIEWTEGDILDIYSLYDALEGISLVYHCAALVSFDGNDKEEIVRTNVSGTENMVNAALDKAISKLCYVSSIAAIGKSENGEMITEDNFRIISKGRSVYSLSKFDAEREVWRGMAEGLNAVIVNPSVILGPGNWDSGSCKLFKTVWQGLKFYTNGVTGYVDVNDVVNAMILLMESDISGERFIVSAENMDYRTFFSLIASGLNRKAPVYKATRTISELAWRFEWIKSLVSGTKPLITKETARTANSACYFSGEKLCSAIGFQYTPIAETISNTCKHFLKDHRLT